MAASWDGHSPGRLFVSPWTTFDQAPWTFGSAEDCVDALFRFIDEQRQRQAGRNVHAQVLAREAVDAALVVENFAEIAGGDDVIAPIVLAYGIAWHKTVLTRLPSPAASARAAYGAKADFA